MDWFLHDWDLRHERIKLIKVKLAQAKCIREHFHKNLDPADNRCSIEY